MFHTGTPVALLLGKGPLVYAEQKASRRSERRREKSTKPSERRREEESTKPSTR
jgi:hypothetical protein